MAAERGQKIKVGVIGAAGYAGGELLRLLLAHPALEVAAVTSRTHAGRPVGEVFPNLAGLTDLRFDGREGPEAVEGCAFVCTAVPAGAALELVPALLAAGSRVVDLSPDYRFRDPEIYRAWYGQEHRAPDFLAEAVYGLPEVHRSRIAAARLVGNPGCYPTAALLGLLPLLEERLIEVDDIVVDAKSGVSGAGRGAALEYHYPECAEDLRAYKVASHRHTPEIEQEASALAGAPARVSFTPHLVPMRRGILATLHLRLRRAAETEELLALYRRRYQEEPFVQVLSDPAAVHTKAVAGSNACHLSLRVDGRLGRVVVVAAIDNLVKGAAGQAVQNLNLMAGLPEVAGLSGAGLWP